MGNILQYLSKPTYFAMLARVYKVWRRDDWDDDTAAPPVESGGGGAEKMCPRQE